MTESDISASKIKIAIIGAGASGMMAAIQSARRGAEVYLYEKNDRPGKKMLITGKGRCNLTNNCSVSDFILNVPTNPKFLYSSISGFSPYDTMNFFEELGVPLKTERGNRVFPTSDKSSDIVNAMVAECKKLSVNLIHSKVNSLAEENGRIIGVITDSLKLYDRVIVATGGLSYPRTGSTGDGYRFAKKIGINVTDLSPSLVPLETSEKWCAALQGLSLKNVSLKVIDTVDSNKTVYSDFGEMLFTHFGVTGPIILSASSHIHGITPGRYKFVIDLKPALDFETLDNRILSDFAKYRNKIYSNSLSDLLPSKLIDIFVSLSGIPADKKTNVITKEERKSIVALMKNLTFTISRPRPIDEAIITSGGIDVKEIYPQTMESKKIKGLYFIGEVLDIDAYTGGFNLQIAFSTAYTAAKAAASDSN